MIIYDSRPLDRPAGTIPPPLCSLLLIKVASSGVVLTEDMFAATEMVAGGEVAFEAMKVEQLKAELAERGSTRSGRKAILQRRLHALLVQDAIERCGENMDV